VIGAAVAARAIAPGGSSSAPVEVSASTDHHFLGRTDAMLSVITMRSIPV
jgi:hypothetical protein